MAENVKIVCARGGGELRLLDNGVVFGVFYGVVDVAAADPVMAFYDALMQRGSITTFVDATEVQSVDTTFRDRVAQWTKSNPSENDTHVLLRSKLVEMAISLMNLFSGKARLLGYTDRARWLAAAKSLGVTLPPAASDARVVR